MKAYQVYKGEQDKHGHQHYELIATYLDRQKAFEHAEKIANETPLYGDKLEFTGSFRNGFCCSWDAVGWERTTIAELREIDIIE
jgi:hypothetical protein